VAVKVGTSLADGSVNATAKLLSLRTGIGGTESEKAYVLKVGAGIQLNAGGSVLDMNDVVGFKLALSGNGQLSFAAGQADLYSAQTLLLRGGIGTGATDVVTKIGTTVAGGSVNAAAKLWSLRAGIGGTEVEYVAFGKDRFSFGQGALDAAVHFVLPNDTTPNLVTVWDNRHTVFGQAGSQGAGLGVSSTSAGGLVNLTFLQPGIAWQSARLYCADLSIYTSGSNLGLAQDAGGQVICNAGLKVIGAVSISGTDSTGTPGAATISKPAGKSSIAVGASSVAITNTLCTAASHVVITAHARDATCKELIAVAGAGSFTVSGSANATAALPFSWEVKALV
jgi:hypothetical protein